jgi:hypothetical protein
MLNITYKFRSIHWSPFYLKSHKTNGISVFCPSLQLLFKTHRYTCRVSHKVPLILSNFN